MKKSVKSILSIFITICMVVGYLSNMGLTASAAANITLYTGGGMIFSGDWDAVNQGSEYTYVGAEDNVQLPTPSIDSATVSFEGWYLAQNLSGSAVSGVVGNGTYYAKWVYNATSATSSNMYYNYALGSADVRGYSSGTYIQTTYANTGFSAYYTSGSVAAAGTTDSYAGTQITFPQTTNTDIFKSTENGIYVAQIATFEGNYVKVTYLVQNRGTSTVSDYNLGIAGDVQIEKNNKAPIDYYTIGDYKYFTMLDNASSKQSFRLYTSGRQRHNSVTCVVGLQQ